MKYKHIEVIIKDKKYYIWFTKDYIDILFIISDTKDITFFLEDEPKWECGTFRLRVTPTKESTLPEEYTGDAKVFTSKEESISWFKENFKSLELQD